MKPTFISTGNRYSSLPESYVRPESDWPNFSQVSDCENVRIIGLGCGDRSLVIQQIRDVCQQCGFFKVVNHGISKEVVEKMQEVAGKFYRLPLEEKLKLYSDDPSKIMRLSTSFNVKKETDHNWRDYLRLYCYPSEQYSPEWPSNPSSSRPAKKQRIEQTDLIFTEKDREGIEFPHSDPLVITTLIENHNVQGILVDTGAKYNVMYHKTLKVMGRTTRHLTPSTTTLVGFSGETTKPLGSIKLSMTFGTAPRQVTTMANFLVIDSSCNYNAILGRETLNEIRSVVSTYHLTMKFPTPHGVGEVKGSQSCF